MELVRGYLDLSVLGVLGLMSFLMIAYAVERFIYFARIDVSAFSTREGLEIALSRHLTIIASIASNAPYVGLLGTVLGILITFHDLSQGADLSVTTIMLGLSLALKATAAGLAVAIPATLLYNALLRRAEVIAARWNDVEAG